MNASSMLLIVTGVATVAMLIGALRNPQSPSRGWIYVSVAILLLSAGAFVLAPDIGGYIAAGLFVALAIVPSQGFRAIDRHLFQGNYAGALRIGRWLRWLHPFYNWAWNDASLLAYQHAEQGDLDGALALLATQDPHDQSLALKSEMYARRLYGDWPALNRWLVVQLEQEEMRDWPDVVAYHIRTLGEIGDLNGMLQAFEEHQTTLGRIDGYLEQCLVFVFAFCGRPGSVQEMYVSGLMGRNEPGFHELWLGTAELAAGDREGAQRRLTPLLKSGDGLYRTGAERRLADGVPLANAILSERSQEVLSRLQQEWRRDVTAATGVESEEGSEN